MYINEIGSKVIVISNADKAMNNIKFFNKLRNID